jgi:hypothetical protein
VTLDQAVQHAGNVGLQLLAALREETGNLDKVIRIGRVFGMVNAAPDLPTTPRSLTAAQTYSSRCSAMGRRASCAVGMGSLPFNMTVEIEAVVEVKTNIVWKADRRVLQTLPGASTSIARPLCALSLPSRVPVTVAPELMRFLISASLGCTSGSMSSSVSHRSPRRGCQKRWSFHLDVDAPLPTLPLTGKKIPGP